MKTAQLVDNLILLNAIYNIKSIFFSIPCRTILKSSLISCIHIFPIDFVTYCVTSLQYHRSKNNKERVYLYLYA